MRNTEMITTINKSTDLLYLRYFRKQWQQED